MVGWRPTFHRGVSVVGEAGATAGSFDFPIIITFPPLPRTRVSAYDIAHHIISSVSDLSVG